MFRNNAWMICGDFNEILSFQDHSNIPSSFDDAGMMDFRNLVNYCSLAELNMLGPHYTWCNKREEELVWKKLDRVLGNQAWFHIFDNSYGRFDAGGCSDHLRASYTIQVSQNNRKIPFKFVNECTHHPDFLPMVGDFWSLTLPIHVSTAAAFMFSKKLKALKPILRRLGRSHIGQIQQRCQSALDKLCEMQEINSLHPTTTNMELELAAHKRWETVSTIEESFLRQKSKIHWLQVGDKNNRYFHRRAKQRQHRNSIREVKDIHGNILCSQEEIKNEAARYFKDFLTTTPNHLRLPSEANINDLICFTCTDEEQSGLVYEITTDEIKNTLFHMPKNKSPGPDGYTVELYTMAWPIIGSDFVNAVKSFFELGFLPKGLNSTILALIPKKEKVLDMKDFRPISCCNVIYKVISKILANRLKLILPRVILRNQSAFVAGRLLLENVLLATELVKNYHLDSISKRAAAKIDIAKAFDTIQWSFVRTTLSAMKVPQQFIHWIMLCISTPSFSVQVNGELAGYFNSTRGLRQGCSLSPYLFVISMNVLSNMLNVAAQVGKIGYHPKCKSLFLTHICFADDLLVFSDGNPSSISGIVEVFNQFAQVSGLKISVEKSTLYMAGHPQNIKENVLSEFGFIEGTFPVKYLGLPLTTKKLTKADCIPLISRLKEKVNTWTARYLSYAGRLQLIASVIAGITNFWLSVFCLPKKCLKEIDSICSAFLWSGPDLNPRKAKVAWYEICSQKREGGLGIRSLVETTKVCYMRLIWRVITRQQSLWVAWVWAKLIKADSFWSIRETTTMGSWVWKKLLQHRLEARKLYKPQVGNGKLISFWFDEWSNLGCLFDLLGSRGFIDLGIPKRSTLHDVITTHQPKNHRSNIMNQIEDQLHQIKTHILTSEAIDKILWRHAGTQYLENFSAKFTWTHTRDQRLIKVWHKLIWFKHATPKFAFCTWLTFQDKLSTGDRMRMWNNGANVRCLLCHNHDETRNHLFFECVYSTEIWRRVMGTLLGAAYTQSWESIQTVLLGQQGSPSKNFLLCYALQTTVYHLWRERNNRKHGQPQLTARILTRIIDKVIRNNISAMQKNSDLNSSTCRTLWFSSRF